MPWRHSARVQFLGSQINVVIRCPHISVDLGLVFSQTCCVTVLVDMSEIETDCFFEQWTNAGQPCDIKPFGGGVTDGSDGSDGGGTETDADLINWETFLRKLIGTGSAAGTYCDLRRSNHTELIELFFPGLVLERYDYDREDS